MPARLLVVTLQVKCLGQPELYLRPVVGVVDDLLEAIDRLVVLPARRQADPHVVKAVVAVLLVKPGEVEHLLGPVVLAKLGIGQDATAVAGLEGGVQALEPLEGPKRLLKPADLVE